MAYRVNRNAGLLGLFLVIAGVSYFSYGVINRNTERVASNIVIEKARLKWYSLSQITGEAREYFYDLTSAKAQDFSRLSEMLDAAAKTCAQMADAAELERYGFDTKHARDIAKDIEGLKASALVYEVETGAGGTEAEAALRLEEAILSAFGRLGRKIHLAGIDMFRKIHERNRAIIDEVYFFQKVLSVAFIFAIIAIVAIALWMSEILSGPIRQMEKATEKIARGDLTAQLKIKTADEIGRLFASFNQMVKELKQSRAQLVEKAYVNSIIDNMADALIVTGLEGEIKTVNKAARGLFGYSEEFLAGKQIDILFAQEEKGASPQIQKLKEADVMGNYETLLKAKDGRLIPALVRGSALYGGRNAKTGFILVARDITERRELEKARRLTELGKLAADVAHEVNNPLTVIAGRAQLLLMQDLKEENLNENLGIIVDYCRKAKDIIVRLLKFSKPSKAQTAEIDINKTLEEVASIVEYRFKRDNIAIRRNYADGLPLLCADEKQLQEVFMNLLNNAHDAMEKGGTATISTSAQKGLVKISIEDTGTGISKDAIGKIFDPFFTTKEKGTGLGLAISYNIIKSHGGELTLQSRPGAGAQATITMPAKKQA